MSEVKIKIINETRMVNIIKLFKGTLQLKFYIITYYINHKQEQEIFLIRFMYMCENTTSFMIEEWFFTN